MMISRRRFLLAGTGVVAAACGGLPALAAPAAASGAWAATRTRAATRTVALTGTAIVPGQHLELPFRVPLGVNRVDVSVTRSGGDAVTGVGLFDHRGAGYQSAGFRGVYGEERSSFFVAAHEASQSFLPGRVVAGTWTVVVPVFRVIVPTTVTATVVLIFGPQQRAVGFGPEPGVVVDAPGWYRGDLHCHTPESSDAWKSGSALAPAQWAAEARRTGLDYLAMTDHNVVSQNLHLAADAGPDVLLMAGEEMTNWFHGHATVSGIDPGDWLDWRQAPAGLPLPSGKARIQDFLAVARDMGAYVSAAHPLAANLSWQFFADGDLDPAARPAGIEVWTGPFQPDDELALLKWDDLLRRGWRTWVNGGSDLHGVVNDGGFVFGTPTTVVYAERLSKRAVVDALRQGRSFVTRVPDGVEIYLTATGPAGQRQVVGGSIYGGPLEVAAVEVLVRRAAGMRLILLRDGIPISITPITADEQTVRTQVPILVGGYVRAEVRGQPFVDPANPLASRLDMEALTNPIFLVNGRVPPGARPVTAPPGPPGPRRQVPATAS